jgi:EAL domain-containing protein (putative c-di-GMP-specific phosphodiesterase class I)/GGDEF domain-containing protein
MEARGKSGPTWRGWAARGTAGARAVTSGRLPWSAQPGSRLFPKTRSWFALDAPLELLSPLSVIRVLLVLAVVTWPVVGLTAPRSEVDTVGLGTVTAVTVVTGVIWLALLRVKKLDVRGCRALTAYLTAAVAVLVWSSHGGGPAVAFALFLVPLSVCSALFLDRRTVVVQLAGTGVLLTVALAPVLGGARAGSTAVAGVLALSLAPVAVIFLARSARRHDTVDPDTGVPNGFGLAQRLAAGEHTAYLVAAVVLDGIGNAREALGYQVGTELLRRAVEDLGQVLPADAVIGRVTGDELVVTLGLDAEALELGGSVPPGSGATAPGSVSMPSSVVDAGASLADTLVRAIGTGRYLVGEIEVSLGAHVGLTAAPWGGGSVAELVRRASLSARRAADSGRRLAVWDGDHDTLTAADLTLLADLRAAPGRGELSLAYQPQVSSGSKAPRAVEALLRWTSPAHGAVSPGRFILLAERTGLIDRLTEWVFLEALDAQVRWRRQGIDIPVSINLSAKSIPMPGLSDWILGQVRDRGLLTSCLTIEVTETAVADPAQAIEVLDPLHRQGVRVSIDDFGTGTTSLAALPTLPVDELKVDQCFVLRSTGSPADEAIVRTVAELAHRLGLQVVAEGVESADISALLSTMDIDLLQGFHLARPMAEPELVAYLGDAATDPAAGPTGPVGADPRMITPAPRWSAV